jgi:hypothetical protein
MVRVHLVVVQVVWVDKAWAVAASVFVRSAVIGNLITGASRVMIKPARIVERR